MSTANLYCSMIHGGLHLNVKNTTLGVQSCCIRRDWIPIVPNQPFWNVSDLESLREINASNRWAIGCENCENLEKSGMTSMRLGMNQGLGIHGKTNLSGPARIDIKHDISCNLACRTCGPQHSTFWQKHLKENKRWHDPISTSRMKNDVIKTLATLDFSNLKQVVFCGGETLLGQEYWDVARWIVDNVPDSKKNLTLGFQSNGTQTINEKNYDVIDKCHLVKLHISLDGTDRRFEYLRWPASWNQVTENILRLREKLPTNVMFLIEETISIFNVLYINEVENWVQKNFSTNREGDIVNCTRHLADGIFSLQNASSELVQKLQDRNMQNIIDTNWTENPDKIYHMIDEIKRFDLYRNQSFSEVFPETAESFKRFL